MKLIRLIALLIAIAAGPAVAQTQVPDTPVGKVFSAWLTSFNSGDRSQIEAFDKAYSGDSFSLEEKLGFRKSTGGLVLMRVEKSEPFRLEAILKDVNSDIRGRFILVVSNDAQPRIVSDGIRQIPLSRDILPARLSMADAISGTKQLTDQLAKDGQFSGTLLLARNGEILFQQAWGEANRETGKPVTLSTRFGIGSMNKMFTAVAILQLVEAGKLNLNDTIGKYLPDYPNKPAANSVTIRELLTHTGATGDIFGPEFDSHKAALREHADYIKLYGDRPLKGEPGKQFKYSNYGFILLGAIIEKVSGTSYYDYVESKIFRPSGMNSTGSLPEDVDVPDRAIGYTRELGPLAPNTDLLPFRGTSAGGGYSTVGDLFRFATALQSGVLISKDMLAEATKVQVEQYGYGFFVRLDEQPSYYGHGGGFPGMNGSLKIFPQSGYVVVGLSNFDPPAVDRPLDYFTRRMPLN